MNRNKLIQLAHIGAAKLFADEAERRDWQRARTGHDSCSQMTTQQLDALVSELRRKGALDKRPPRRAGRVPFNRSAYMGKIEAQLADMGLSWQYAEAIAWRVTGGKGVRPGSQGPGIQRLEWVRRADHFRAIIAALHVEQKKRSTMQYILERANALGLSLDDIEQRLPEAVRGTTWQRDQRWLDTIADSLASELLEQESKDA